MTTYTDSLALTVGKQWVDMKTAHIMEAIGRVTNAVADSIRERNNVPQSPDVEHCATGSVLEDLKKLHSPIKRYQLNGYPEWSFATREEAKDHHDAFRETCDQDGDCGWEPHCFEVCGECARIEQDPEYSPHNYQESLWPCRTAQLLRLEEGE